MVSRLKICGITSAADARSCVDLGVDMLGFNFYPSSPRYIAAEAARKIIHQIPLSVITVGILIRPTLEEIQEIIKISRVAVVQIYDPQSIDDFLKIPVPVIRSYRVSEIPSVKIALSGSGMILIDSYSPGKLGGSGRVFDWLQIPDTIPRERLILAGGINPDNIHDALHKVNPAVIDVASGAEISPGKKDLNKIRKLVQAIRMYNTEIAGAADVPDHQL